MIKNSKDVQLKYKTWKQVQEYLEHSDLIIIPIGAVEQHGPSCPVFTDALIANNLAIQLGMNNDVWVAPCISFGDSLIHLNFAGTISLRPSTLMLVIKDYVTSLHKGGFRRFLIVNGHGDNYGVILAAFSELGDKLDNLRYHVKDFWDFQPFRDIMRKEFGDQFGGHADATDASILLAIDKSLVNKDLLVSEFPKVRYWISRDLVSELYTQSGVINSDQRLASSEIGIKLIDEAIKGYTELLKRLSK